MKKLDTKKLKHGYTDRHYKEILIAIGTYNFAAMAKFPMVGFNGIAPDFLSPVWSADHCGSDAVRKIFSGDRLLRILEKTFYSFYSDDHYHIRNYGRGGADVSSLHWRPDTGSDLYGGFSGLAMR